jgi:hypothetical protein
MLIFTDVIKNDMKNESQFWGIDEDNGDPDSIIDELQGDLNNRLLQCL